jgi:hypothetical protein
MYADNIQCEKLFFDSHGNHDKEVSLGDFHIILDDGQRVIKQMFIFKVCLSAFLTVYFTAKTLCKCSHLKRKQSPTPMPLMNFLY